MNSVTSPHQTLTIGLKTFCKSSSPKPSCHLFSVTNIVECSYPLISYRCVPAGSPYSWRALSISADVQRPKKMKHCVRRVKDAVVCRSKTAGWLWEPEIQSWGHNYGLLIQAVWVFHPLMKHLAENRCFYISSRPVNCRLQRMGLWLP